MSLITNTEFEFNFEDDYVKKHPLYKQRLYAYCRSFNNISPYNMIVLMDILTVTFESVLCWENKTYYFNLFCDYFEEKRFELQNLLDDIDIDRFIFTSRNIIYLYEKNNHFMLHNNNNINIKAKLIGNLFDDWIVDITVEINKKEFKYYNRIKFAVNYYTKIKKENKILMKNLTLLNKKFNLSADIFATIIEFITFEYSPNELRYFHYI